MRRTIDRLRGGRARNGASGDLDVISLVAHEPGPTVAIIANLHGDEVTGTGAVHQLDGLLQRELQRGAVALYPSINPEGMALRQRTFPEDGLDLNRVFPGEPLGGPAARQADRVWSDLVERQVGLLIDVHADSAHAVPYVIADRAVSRTLPDRVAMAAEVVRLCDATGLTVLHEYPEAQYQRFQLDRSLAGAMVNRAGVPAVTLECGPRRRLDPVAVSVTVEAILGIMTAIGLVDRPAVPHPSRLAGGPWRRAAAPRTHQPGLLRARVQPGEPFRAGDLLAEVLAVSGDVLDELRAASDGVVVSWLEASWIDAGSVPGTIALLEEA